MREPRRLSSLFALAPLAALAGCSLVLEDPTPFQAEAPDGGADMAAVQPDQGLPPGLDLAVIDMAPPPIDMTPIDQMVVDQAIPDMAPPDAGPACVEEICDGRDNDCDGQIDESFPGQCDPCGVSGGQGLCARGARFCVQGGEQCVPWLPARGEVVDCDLQDNNCNGQIDEVNERNAPRSATGDQVVAVCGEPPALLAEPGEGCGVDPRVVGCAPAHACVPPGCLSQCWGTLQALQGSCNEVCSGPSGPALTACFQRLTDCHALLRADFEACVAECPTGDATRWACENAQSGPACTATDCPDGTRPDGRDCVAD